MRKNIIYAIAFVIALAVCFIMYDDYTDQKKLKEDNKRLLMEIDSISSVIKATEDSVALIQFQKLIWRDSTDYWYNLYKSSADEPKIKQEFNNRINSRTNYNVSEIERAIIERYNQRKTDTIR